MDTKDQNGAAELKGSTAMPLQPIANTSVIPSVHLVGKPHPLRTETFCCEVAPGQTLAEMFSDLNTEHLSIRVNGVMFPRETWSYTRPKPGTVIEVLSLPHGDNLNQDQAKGLTIAASVILVVLVAIATYGAGTGAAAAIGISATSAVASAVGAAAGAVVGIAGQLAIGALIKPAAPKPLAAAADAKQAFGITASSNEARPYGVVSCVLGEYRMFPPVCAVPFGERTGLTQWVRFLFDLGYGNLTVSDMRIGNSGINDYPDSQVQIGVAPSLYSQDVDVTPLVIPLPTNTSETTTETETSTNTSEISIDFSWASGFFAVTTTNETESVFTGFKVEYRAYGTSDPWISVATEALGFGAGIRHQYIRYSGAVPTHNKTWAPTYDPVAIWQVASGGSRDPLFVSMTFKPKPTWNGTHWVPTAGKYVVRIGRLDNYRYWKEFRLLDQYNDGFTSNRLVSGHYRTFASAIAETDRSTDSRWEQGVGYALKPKDQWYRSTLPAEYGPAPVLGSPYFGFNVFWQDTTFTGPAPTEGWVKRKLILVDPAYAQGGCTWAQLRSIKYEVPSTLDTTKAAVLVKATARLQGEINQFSAFVQQNIPVWNGSSWVSQTTTNPAWIFRWLLTGCPGNGRLIDVLRMDDPTIIAWAAHCTAKGYTFSTVIEQSTTMFALLQDICAAGRATFTVRDSLYSVVMDVPQATPVQHFTPRNSLGFGGSRTFGDTIHALKCRFINPNASYQMDERIVYDDGYAAVAGGGNLAATKFEVFEFRGATSADAVWRLARYHMAVARLRQNEYSWKTDVEHLVCQRGDLVKMSHDLVNWGLGWGRVIDRDVQGSVWNQTFPVPTATGVASPHGGFGVAVTVGTRFTVTEDCVCTGAYYVRPSAINHTFKLWTDGGVLLTDGSAGTTGNSVAFRSPQKLTAGQFYVVTYYASDSFVSYKTGLHYGTEFYGEPVRIPANSPESYTGRLAVGDVFPTTGAIVGGATTGEGYMIDPIVTSSVGRGSTMAVKLDESPEMYENTALVVRARKETGATHYSAIRTRNQVYSQDLVMTRASAVGSYRSADGALKYVVNTTGRRHELDSLNKPAGLRVESATTNLLLQSDNVGGTTPWTSDLVGLATGPAGPDGVTASKLITAQMSVGTHYVQQAFTSGANPATVFSVFVRPAGGRYVGLSLTDLSLTLFPFMFDLQAMTCKAGSYGTCGLEAWGNGWVRIWCNAPVTTAYSGIARVSLINQARYDLAVQGVSGGFVFDHLGDGGGVAIIGAMCESTTGTKTRPSSYVPTIGSTVSRPSELATVAVSTLTEFYRVVNAGTFIVEFKPESEKGASTVFFFDSNGGYHMELSFNSGVWGFGNYETAAHAEVGVLPNNLGNWHRAAVSYRNTPSGFVCSLSVDGSTAVNVPGFIPGFSIARLILGGDAVGNRLNGSIRKFHALGRALSNSELQSAAIVDAQIPGEGMVDLITPSGVSDGDLVMVGSPLAESVNLIVTKIVPDSDMAATITAVEEAPAVYTADDPSLQPGGVIPVFVSSITGTPFQEAPKTPILSGILRVDTATDTNGRFRFTHLGLINP